MTASFLDELLRRAVLESVTRALLGVPSDQSGPVMSPPMGPGPGVMPFDRGFGGHGGAAWLTGAVFDLDEGSTYGGG